MEATQTLQSIESVPSYAVSKHKYSQASQSEDRQQQNFLLSLQLQRADQAQRKPDQCYIQHGVGELVSQYKTIEIDASSLNLSIPHFVDWNALENRREE
jgi:hypothetical protein